MSNIAQKWFEKAIANKPEVLSVKIKGTKKSYKCLGRKIKTWLNFYSWWHGTCKWWSFIAPYFAKTHRVIAMNLGGMGDSEWKKNIQLSLGGRNSWCM